MGLLGRQWNRAAAALGTHGFSVDLNGPLTLCRLKEWLRAQGLGSDHGVDGRQRRGLLDEPIRQGLGQRGGGC
jgi:hypothetical protein